MLLRSAPIEEITALAPPRLDECIRASLRLPNIWQSVMENLLYISSLNREFAKALLSRFHQNATLRREAYAFCYPDSLNSRRTLATILPSSFRRGTGLPRS